MKSHFHPFILGLLAIFLYLSCQTQSTIHISGNPDNDLIKVLQENNKIQIQLHESPDQALGKLEPGDGLIVLANNYPNQRETLSQEFYESLKAKNIRAYLEFPSMAPGYQLGDTEEAHGKRAVINSSFFGSVADSLEILGLNGLHYINCNSNDNLLVAAKVAGFDSAIYGLPEDKKSLLFQWAENPVLVSTTNLSQFISGRYAPQAEWAAIWQSILTFVQPNLTIDSLTWTPTVQTTYGKEEKLPADFEKTSVQRGINWYKEARMLVPNDFDDTLQALTDSKKELYAGPNIPYGDGSQGVFECIFSDIDANGNQPIGTVKRGDCISETAMAFAAAGALLQNDSYLKTSENLLDYYLFESIALTDGYADPKHGAYGLIPWGITSYPWFKANYGDDNARFLLGAMVSSSLTKATQWDEIIMRSLIACMRTTGKNGFRGSRVNLTDFGDNGWKYYRDRDITNLSPHFESYLWACYLWAYDKTQDLRFLEVATKGIYAMMDQYPDGWRWTNGLAQERARMILPLAWLVRVDNSDSNKEMLMTVVNDFLKLQDGSGAIREELGKIEMGKYPPPQSNEAYGTTEAPLIAENGDPVSDLLYTTNFAFLGLHEAAYATQDPTIQKATDKLAEFLCRVQVKSAGHPELDGGWMRAFDFERFEHWGSNADHGWGAWAIETGWTQGWITTILALREMDQSIWELTKDSKVNNHFNKFQSMLQ